jgi:sugar phosphate isomerase/epimerase
MHATNKFSNVVKHSSMGIISHEITNNGPGQMLKTGISAEKRRHDLSDFAAELDTIEKLGVASIELPTYDMDIVIGSRIRPSQLEALKRACASRAVSFTTHGPLGINFMDEPYRLQRHFDVLKPSLEVAAEVGAINYVLHAGVATVQQADGIEDRYVRQRDFLSKAGDIAAALKINICVESMYGEFEGNLHTPTPIRLAQELAMVNHPNVAATLDFSHAYLWLDYIGRRADYVAEIATLAPFAKHLHIHDSFGRQDDIYMYTEGERLAYGHGDLHLPVGWGDIPWDALLQRCTFADDVVFNIELSHRYWYAAQQCVDDTKKMASKARTISHAIAAE